MTDSKTACEELTAAITYHDKGADVRMLLVLDACKSMARYVRQGNPTNAASLPEYQSFSGGTKNYKSLRPQGVGSSI